MIVAQPTNLLANQMFTYASVKSIALDKQVEFKYINKYASFGERRYSDMDQRYGQDFDTIFLIPTEECINELPSNIGVVKEKQTKYGNKVYHAYQEEMLNMHDNTLVDGLLVSPKYFEHRLKEVRKWFQFKEDIEKWANYKMKKLREKYPGKKIVSVHFRVGKDYKDSGYLLKYAYWNDAGLYMMEQYHDDVVFLIFYDRWMRYLDRFTAIFPYEICHGSLAEDLCLMAKCDANIISNSTFSIWGSILNEKSEITVRPSLYPIHSNMIQEESFLDSWYVMKAERSFISGFLGKLHYGGFKRRCVNSLHKLLCAK